LSTPLTSPSCFLWSPRHLWPAGRPRCQAGSSSSGARRAVDRRQSPRLRGLSLLPVSSRSWCQRSLLQVIRAPDGPPADGMSEVVADDDDDVIVIVIVVVIVVDVAVVSNQVALDAVISNSGGGTAPRLVARRGNVLARLRRVPRCPLRASLFRRDEELQR